MRCFWSAAIMAAVAFAALTGRAEAAHNTPAAYALSGRCLSFTLAGRSVPHGCMGSLLNLNNDRGGTAFTFTFADGAIVSFEGAGDQQVNPTSNTAAQPIKAVFFSLGISGVAPHRIKAVGICRYANPDQGPMTVDCSAETASGMFAGRFQTDGRAPTELSH